MAVTTTRFQSQCLGRFVTFTAVIPFEDYGNFMNPNPKPYDLKKPLRTLYLLHGITGDDRDWLYGTQIEMYAKENNIAVIMPDGHNNFYVDNNPTDCWGEFIGKELVEFTRALYPLSDKREDTYIGGLSMGGYGAIRNGLKYSDTFSKIVALSSALVVEDASKSTEDAPMPFQRKSAYDRIFGGDVSKVIGSDMDPKQLFLDCKNPMKIMMTVGVDDFLLKNNRDYKAFLEKNGADLYYYEDEGSHEWDFWNRNIKVGMKWLNDGSTKE